MSALNSGNGIGQINSTAVAMPPGFLERFAEQFEEDTLPQIVSELSESLLAIKYHTYTSLLQKANSKPVISNPKVHLNVLLWEGAAEDKSVPKLSRLLRLTNQRIKHL